MDFRKNIWISEKNMWIVENNIWIAENNTWNSENNIRISKKKIWFVENNIWKHMKSEQKICTSYISMHTRTSLKPTTYSSGNNDKIDWNSAPMLKSRSVIFFPTGRSPAGKKMTLRLFGIVPLKCRTQSNSSFYIYLSYLLITSPDFSLSSSIPCSLLISLLPHPLLTARGRPLHQRVHYAHLCRRCPSLLLWLHPSTIDSSGHPVFARVIWSACIQQSLTSTGGQRLPTKCCLLEVQMCMRML